MEPRNDSIRLALDQIDELRSRVLESQRFKGYSGRARAVGGAAALAGAFVMGAPGFPAEASAHLAGWGAVFTLGVLLNYGALLHWFYAEPGLSRDWRRLAPAASIFPPLFAGGVISLALVLENQHRLLFGVWMILYAVAHVTAPRGLPRSNRTVGLYYMLAGCFCLLSPRLAFVNPWPMGIVFFLGELAGGLVLHRHRAPSATLGEFLGRTGEPHP